MYYSPSAGWIEAAASVAAAGEILGILQELMQLFVAAAAASARLTAGRPLDLDAAPGPLPSEQLDHRYSQSTARDAAAEPVPAAAALERSSCLET